VRIEVPTNVPGAATMNTFVRWVSGSVVPEGGLGGPAMQPSMSWAPIGQVALDRGAFDSALGLGSSSSDQQAAQVRLEGTFRQFKEDVKEEALQEQGVMASSVVVTTGFSIGYVLWLARGGALLASLASAIPAWTSVDPLPVLSNYKGRGGKGPGGEDLDDPAENAGMPGSRKDDVEDMFRSMERPGHAPVAESRPKAPSASPPASPAASPAPSPDAPAPEVVRQASRAAAPQP
jgi:hypothetical protein